MLHLRKRWAGIGWTEANNTRVFTTCPPYYLSTPLPLSLSLRHPRVNIVSETVRNRELMSAGVTPIAIPKTEPA